MNRKWRLLVLVVATLTGLPVAGQESSGDVTARNARATLVDPSLSDGVASGLSQVTLISSGDATSLRAEIGFPLGDWAFALKVKTPIKSGQEEADLFDVAGLTGGSQGTLSATRVTFGLAEGKGLTRFCKKYNEAMGDLGPLSADWRECAKTVASRAEQWEGVNETALDHVARARAERDRAWHMKLSMARQQALATTCVDYNKTGALPIFPSDCQNETKVRAKLPREWITKLDAKLEELATKVCQEFNGAQPVSYGWIPTRGESGCTLSVLEERDPDLALRAAREINLSPRVFSLAGTMSHQRFDFIDLTSPGDDSGDVVLEDPTKESKFGLAITATAGRIWFTRRGPMYGGVGAALSRAFEGAPAFEVCGPSSVAGVDLCRTIATAGPKEKNRQFAFAEARLRYGDRFGLIPRVAYEFEDGVLGGQLTSYFLVHESKGLNGGIDLAYRDDGKGLVARVFIGLSFGLVPGLE